MMGKFQKGFTLIKSSRSKDYASGFTLIELLLVIAVMSILVVLYSSIGTSFLVRNYSQNTLNEFVSTLRIAQLNAMSSKGDSAWGVRVENNQVILFSGNSYATRNNIFDEKHSYPSTIGISPSQTEVVFSKLTGNTTPTSFTLSSNIETVANISINTFGNVDVN